MSSLIVKEFKTVVSTNDILKEKDLRNLDQGYCVLAEEQTRGRGQRGKQWHAQKGLNLLCSILLKPNCVPSEQFELLQVVSLSIQQCLKEFTGRDCKIKWPNDILYEGQKLAGMLLENFIQDGRLISIAGIGINVNQERFPDFRPEATSMKRLSGDIFEVKSVLVALYQAVEHYLKFLPKEGRLLKRAYDQQLYARGETHDFETAKGEYLVAEVVGVDQLGRLILIHQGKPRAFLFGEIRWLF